jgi:hypothetical protein
MHCVDRAIARIGGSQDNVVSLERLSVTGLGRGAISHRVQAGAMQRLHRTVYLLRAVPPTPMAGARAAARGRGGAAARRRGDHRDPALHVMHNP